MNGCESRRPRPASSCLAASLYYRTRVEAKDSDEFPVVLFHRKSFDQAAFEHRKVVGTVADARGDAVRLWRAIESEASLGEACLRFRDKCDRRQLERPAD